MRLLVYLPIAALCLAALVAGLVAHPFAPAWPAAGVALWLVFLALAPRLRVVATLALIPVLDLAPFSGWIFFEDFDFLTLATLAAGYAALCVDTLRRPGRAHAMLPLAPGGKLLIGLYLATLAISGAIGLLPLAPLDANAFAHYFSPYNALRLAKAPVAAALMLPLLLRELRLRPGSVPREIGLGLVLGLALAGASVVWERLAFLSLTDLASDFRVTGLFAGTHTGGAALDGYLAATLPFAVLALLGARTPLRLAGAGAVLLLSAYAVLVTFSRGLYAAVAVCTVLQVTLQAWPLRPRAGAGAGHRLRPLAVAAGALLLGYGFLVVAFDSAGYRGMAAFAGLALCLYLAGGQALRPPDPPALLLAGAMALAGALVAWLLPKGPYVAYALAWAACLFSLLRPEGRLGAYAWPGVLIVAAAAVAVAVHWGGDAALLPTAAVAAGACALAFAHARRGQPLWQRQQAGLPALLVAAVVLAVTVVSTHTWYATSRLASSGQDFSGRIAHWRAVLASGDGGWLHRVFGNGLGRMPSIFLWHNGTADLPGLFSIETEGGNRFLRLNGARYREGYGDALRILQAVQLDSPRVEVTLDLRTRQPNTRLAISVCARHLIYSSQCAGDVIPLPDDGAWHTRSVSFDTSALVFGGPAVPRPLFLVLQTETQKTVIDIDNVRLSGSRGGRPLRNAGFADGMDHWFFSSDRIHLAWHAKSLFLHTFIEQGAAGVLLLAALCVSALVRLARPIGAGSGAAAAAALSLAGFLIVGAFDSLLDVPRVALLFYLGLFTLAGVSRSQLFPPRPRP